MDNNKFEEYNESDLFRDAEDVDNEKGYSGYDASHFEHTEEVEPLSGGGEPDTKGYAPVYAGMAQSDEGNINMEVLDALGTSDEGTKVRKPRRAKRRFRLNIIQFLKFILSIFLVCALLGAGLITMIIVRAPKIETHNIYSMLPQSSMMYDANGVLIDNVYGEQNRVLIELKDIPPHVQNAFIALEDKTFKTHSGFNIIRIFGAIRDALMSGGQISGTSTITQQLARNLFLADEKSDRTLSRKVTEAYYTVQIEQKLNKNQILEAYLNTVYFGEGRYGIKTAAKYYFSKEVSELTIPEAAILASIPQQPSYFPPVQEKAVSEVAQNDENILLNTGEVVYMCVSNVEPRMQTCISLMHEQGLISDEQYNEIKDIKVRDVVNPSVQTFTSKTGFFPDFVMGEVIRDLQKQYGYDEEKARKIVWEGGVNIYTTLDSQAQAVLEQEFANVNNFPSLVGMRKDWAGNILSYTSNDILLYSMSNYIRNDTELMIQADEFVENPDGSITLLAGKKLALYATTVQGMPDCSIEMKDMYLYYDDLFFIVKGGYINVPQGYKTMDEAGNVTISAEFIQNNPEFFIRDGDMLITQHFSLRESTMQPQAAMTIVENSTGSVKAMIGGRNTSGRMILNRAVSPRQPGSSIKPLGGYSAALQKSFECSEAGETFPFVDNKFGNQGANLWGNYITAGSVVIDEPTYVKGKPWPKNFYSGYRGFLNFRSALLQSVNVCSAKIVNQVGVDYCFEHAKKFGLSTMIDPDDRNLATFATGGFTQGVTTLDMANAYTAFANPGWRKTYNCYTQVTDRQGNVILEPEITQVQVMDPGVAWIMRDILISSVTQGLAGGAAIGGGVSVGAKTGTTDDQKDFWCCSFTPNYSAAIWVGSDVPITLTSSSSAIARLLGNCMSQIDNARIGTYSGRPSNVIAVTVDGYSGMLPADTSVYTRTEYFTSGTQPGRNGTIHAVVDICEESGFLATPSCPHKVSTTGVNLPYELEDTEERTRLGALPKYYCNLHNPEPHEYATEPGLPVTVVPIPDNPNNPNDPNNPDPGGGTGSGGTGGGTGGGGTGGGGTGGGGTGGGGTGGGTGGGDTGG